MNVQMCNKSIYEKIGDTLIGMEKGAQHNQRQLTKAAIPLVNVLNELSDVHAGDTIDVLKLEAIISHVEDSLTVLSHENRKINMQRKSKLVKALENALKPLKTVHEPEASHLFGSEADLGLMVAALRKQQINL